MSLQHIMDAFKEMADEKPDLNLFYDALRELVENERKQADGWISWRRFYWLRVFGKISFCPVTGLIVDGLTGKRVYISSKKREAQK